MKTPLLLRVIYMIPPNVGNIHIYGCMLMVMFQLVMSGWYAQEWGVAL